MSKIEELEKEIKELKAKRDSIEQQIETKVKKMKILKKIHNISSIHLERLKN